MSLYIDTSAAAKLLVEEAESEALAGYLDSVAGENAIVSSLLLETELRRVAVRFDLDQSSVTDLLGRIDLVDPSRSMFREAGVLPGAHLRSLDALHLATAMRVDVETVITYDARFVAAARDLGFTVHSPV